MTGQPRLFWIDDAQWKLVAPLLRREKNGPGKIGDRAIISGIIHVLRTGCAWQDCPAVYGPHLTIFRRFNYLRNRGTLAAILNVMNEPLTRPPSSQSLEQHSPASDHSDDIVPSLGASPPIGGSPDHEPNQALSRLHEAAAERDAVAAQLREIALAHRYQPTGELIDALATWHLAALEQSRATSWTPGLLKSLDPLVQKATDRFHMHQMKNGMERLTMEAHDLRLKLLVALACVNFYAEGATNSGFARTTLKKLAGIPDDEPGERPVREEAAKRAISGAGQNSNPPD